MSAYPQAIDTLYAGQRQQICCWQVDEHTIVDPGPSVSLDAIREALAGTKLKRILVTHIHLDHSGGVGVLLREHPDAEVWVSIRGSRHLIAPERLIASAEQVYGGAEALAEMFGEIAPVPAERVRIVAEHGPETVDEFQIVETPGHAKHHVSFFHTPTGDAYVGDTASVRLPGNQYVLPMTTPPDIDRVAWNRSLDQIEAWHPRRLMLTHFGAFDDVSDHLHRTREGLRIYGDLAGVLDAEAWGQAMEAGLAAATGRPHIAGYATNMPTATLYQGLQIERDRIAAATAKSAEQG